MGATSDRSACLSPKEDPKSLTKTQIMQERQARKTASRSMTRSFTTGLMPLSLSARSSDPDMERPESPAASSRKDEENVDEENQGLNTVQKGKQKLS